MATLDMRKFDDGVVDGIVFADDSESDDWYIATLLQMYDEAHIEISCKVETMKISKTSIPHLIKALQKAQEIWKD